MPAQAQAQEIFTAIEKAMKTRVLTEHSFGAEALMKVIQDKIDGLRKQLIALMPESKRVEGTEALDGDLDRLYSHCRRQWNK